MNKSLIYYVCYGTKQLPLLSASIESVRALGKYTGEIIVFSDQKVSIPGCDYLEVIDPKGNWEDISMGRVNCGLTISGDYSSVAYLDNDILAIKDIKSFFEDVNCFRASVPYKIYNNPTFLWPFHKDEFKKAIQRKSISVCSGAFISPYSMLHSSLKSWKKTFDTALKDFNYSRFKEENSLTVSIFNEMFEFKELDFDLITIPKSITNKTCLVHFYYTLKKNMISYYNSLIKEK